MTKRPDDKPEKQSRIPDLRAEYNHLLTTKGAYDMDYVVKLKNVRLSFPGLFEAKPFKPGDKPTFKATLLIEKGSENDKIVREAIDNLAKEKWGKKAASTLKAIENNPNKFNYQDGDSKSYDGYGGMMALSAKAKESNPPLVIDRDKKVLREKDGKPYAGCYVNASVELFAYNNSGDGISASLRWVQFFKDGDAFAGGKPVDEEEIDDCSDGSDADDIA